MALTRRGYFSTKSPRFGSRGRQQGPGKGSKATGQCHAPAPGVGQQVAGHRSAGVYVCRVPSAQAGWAPSFKTVDEHLDCRWLRRKIDRGAGKPWCPAGYFKVVGSPPMRLGRFPRGRWFNARFWSGEDVVDRCRLHPLKRHGDDRRAELLPSADSRRRNSGLENTRMERVEVTARAGSAIWNESACRQTHLSRRSRQ